jgi:HlyD family secretion protein
MPEPTNHIPSQPEDSKSWPELDVHSEEVQEIIGRPPHWLIRWGITAFFGVLAAVIASASIIRYPEVIPASLRLTATDAPQSVESRITGKIVKLLVENNQSVHEGDLLAWMQSTANHEQVLQLSAMVDSMSYWLQNEAPEGIFHEIHLPTFNNLGEIQHSFQVFEQSMREYLSYQPGGYFSRQRTIMDKELGFILQLHEKLLVQKELQQADYELAQREYEIQKRLAEGGHIAPIELARAEQAFASRRLPLQQTESAIIHNLVSQTAKEKEIMELDKRINEQQTVFFQSLHGLRSTINEWKATYLITAPFSGKVVFAGILQVNQTISTGQEVFYIQPENTQFFGELAVSQQSFGKTHVGQRVMVRFNGYPFHEFGSVYGEVDYFSDFPVRDSLFFAKVHFPDGLTTNYGREIIPRNGMTGQAEIITQDMRLLQRVYNNITKELR